MTSSACYVTSKASGPLLTLVLACTIPLLTQLFFFFFFFWQRLVWELGIGDQQPEYRWRCPATKRRRPIRLCLHASSSSSSSSYLFDRKAGLGWLETTTGVSSRVHQPNTACSVCTERLTPRPLGTRSKPRETPRARWRRRTFPLAASEPRRRHAPMPALPGRAISTHQRRQRVAIREPGAKRLHAH